MTVIGLDRLLNCRDIFERLDYFVQKLATSVVVSILSATEKYIDFYFMFVAQEFAGFADLEVDVVSIDFCP